MQINVVLTTVLRDDMEYKCCAFHLLFFLIVQCMPVWWNFKTYPRSWPLCDQCYEISFAAHVRVHELKTIKFNMISQGCWRRRCMECEHDRIFKWGVYRRVIVLVYKRPWMRVELPAVVIVVLAYLLPFSTTSGVVISEKIVFAHNIVVLLLVFFYFYFFFIPEHFGTGTQREYN